MFWNASWDALNTFVSVFPLSGMTGFAALYARNFTLFFIQIILCALIGICGYKGHESCSKSYKKALEEAPHDSPPVTQDILKSMMKDIASELALCFVWYIIAAVIAIIVLHLYFASIPINMLSHRVIANKYKISSL